MTLNHEFVTVELLASLFNEGDHGRGRLIGIIPAKRIQEILNDVFIEPTRLEYFKKNWKLAGSL